MVSVQPGACYKSRISRFFSAIDSSRSNEVHTAAHRRSNHFNQFHLNPIREMADRPTPCEATQRIALTSLMISMEAESRPAHAEQPFVQYFTGTHDCDQVRFKLNKTVFGIRAVVWKRPEGPASVLANRAWSLSLVVPWKHPSIEHYSLSTSARRSTARNGFPEE